MSTYNGEKYVKQQINSILSQNDVDIFLTIRDDGSTDNTVLILNEYSKLTNVSVTIGENVGFRESFIALYSSLREENSNYYAFSDQDDEWLPEKMIRAIEMLDKNGGKKPTLYISDRYIANEDLSKVTGKVYDNYPPYDWNAAPISRFIDSRGAGCVQVWNKAGQKLLEHYTPYNITHDEWVSAVFTFMGAVVYDERSFINYRRHINNVSGTTNTDGNLNFFQKLTLLVNKLEKKQFSQNIDYRAQLLLNGYRNQLSEKDIKSLTAFAEYKHSFSKKLYILFSKKIKVTSSEAPFNYQLMKILMLFTNGL
ncbi:glycosyltransferase [Leuconostoc carnosum]|uniref:glycosyltransferase n=1 Tax=Leuconostoc carnosum TaxID=1252 RepID=UPI001CC245B6|nr:glycosyltransferase [Leuconostoc carnosum]